MKPKEKIRKPKVYVQGREPGVPDAQREIRYTDYGCFKKKEKRLKISAQGPLTGEIRSNALSGIVKAQNMAYR